MIKKMAKFDIEESAVKKLAELLNETGLSEIEVRDGNKSIRIARSIHGNALITNTTEASLSELPSNNYNSPEEKNKLSSNDAITAPMVGVVYLSPEPGAENFVKLGDTVKKGDTLLLIEAMKTFNPVRASKNGKVTEILISDKLPVEFGEELMIIK
ncbi:MAG: acetyl-CoA carboxylase biotin carboxyl carrier protein subunit [Rhodospirillaceae bacterium]|nr:acetyl-CoA carboxylase biotin carboxyl carrier protein subunit [Rhodospirillaceae bacterium]